MSENGEQKDEESGRAPDTRRAYIEPAIVEEDVVRVLALSCGRFTKRACGPAVNQS